jgi:glycosyltransferase involved in cell wall biosynthesis
LAKVRFSAIKAQLSIRLFPFFARQSNWLPVSLNPTNYPAIKVQVQNILAERREHQPILLFPPSLDWNTQLFQRPQQLALAFARQGAFVFYLQPPPYPRHGSFEFIEERLLLCRFPIEVLADLPSPFVYLLTWNRAFAQSLRSARIIYDVVDEIEAFSANAAKLRREHERLLKDAQLVIASARQLYEQAIRYRPDALLCPNGVDYDLFTTGDNRELKTPPDIAPISELGRPIIGYYGALARWFDYALMTKVASLRPDLSFVLIGPDYDSTLPPELLDLPNVYWLGVKPYHEIPLYLHHFDVAVIPFVVNEVTNAVSPLKLFEYMAAQKPVVITPMRESSQYPGVLLASTATEFAHQLDKALSLREDAAYRALLNQLALENTWQARAEQILKAISSSCPVIS